MIELNSVFVILMIEAVIALALLVFGFYILSKNKSSGEQKAVSVLIDKLEDTEKIRLKKLGEMIVEHRNIDEMELKELLAEVGEQERLLYQQVILIFLNNDQKALKKIDQYVDKLAEPYCKILCNSTADSTETEKLETAENNVRQLNKESEKLSKQLNVAMSTMDEISAEYTRVFSGTQTELELENSSKKMFEIFNQAEQKIKAASKNVEAEEL